MQRIWIAALWIGVAALSGCQPFYRDDELRALRAQDAARKEALTAAGMQALKAGHAARAERLFAQVIAQNPACTAESYLLLARAHHAAAHHAAARATARLALKRPEGRPEVHAEARRFLVAAYAEARLVGRALDWLLPQTLTAAVKVPELAAALTPLVEAEQLASMQPAQALARYAEWLAAYGEPDHPLLRTARTRILDAAAPLTADFAERAAGLLARGEALSAMRWVNLAYRYQRDEQLNAAPLFSRVCAAVPNVEATSSLASSEAQRGNLALRSDRLGEAIESYRRAVTAAPCWAAAHRSLALLLMQAELRDEAVRQMSLYFKLRAAPAAEKQALRGEWAGFAF